MDNLICHTANCEHNVKSRCRAGIIDVNEKGVCKTKVKREGGVIAQTFADIEAAEDYGILDENATSVHCDSLNCKHNRATVCCADHIIVDDGLRKTKCVTREKKAD